MAAGLTRAVLRADALARHAADRLRTTGTTAPIAPIPDAGEPVRI